MLSRKVFYSFKIGCAQMMDGWKQDMARYTQSYEGMYSMFPNVGHVFR